MTLKMGVALEFSLQLVNNTLQRFDFDAVCKLGPSIDAK